jgi:uncharacterized HhH-GPD family protein
MKEEIKQALIRFGNEIGQKRKEKYFTPNPEADDLIWNNPLAYLFAVILDQSMPAERVWATPFILKSRLGHLDVNEIAKLEDSDIKRVFTQQPKLHRFPNVMALRIKKASQLLLDKYNGNAENIWNDCPRSDDLQRRFEEFDGIGQKKASMATNILVRDFGKEVKDRKGIDVSYDIHVRRVFVRSGLSEKDDRDTIIQVARKLCPEYPGILDNPCWEIGRTYCHPNSPNCAECPISPSCLKLTNIKLLESI